MLYHFEVTLRIVRIALLTGLIAACVVSLSLLVVA